MSRLGNKIKEERMKKGMSPKQLAKKCGVAETFILDVESGKKILNEKLLTQISKVLGKNIEEEIAIEPTNEEQKETKRRPQVQEKIHKRKTIVPLEPWEDALSNIIKKVPILDIYMQEIKGYRSFPIINKKVEGFHPDKLAYIEIPDDMLMGFRICKKDKILLYLHQELVNNSFALVEYEGKRRFRKIKRIEGHKIELISYKHEIQKVTQNLKDVKIIGRGIRVEMELSHF
ncbi:helix-turn-helix domain-containing protein [Clostridiaceae bacterium 35-E11]